ncbi:MAG: LuxR C-terminal-related transcriptional regulator [Chloroflexi bacterium]|nr:LuxR C-terminal-related transcriptional regulator [Chloroflexota bacterium]
MAVVVEVLDPSLAANTLRAVGNMPGVSVVVREKGAGRAVADAPASKGETLRRIIVGQPVARDDGSSGDAPTIVDLLQQGIWAVVSTESAASKSLEMSLKEYVEQVGSGLCPLLNDAVSEPVEVERILASMKARAVQRTPRGARKSPLSDGETEILQRVAHGDKNWEIARDLGFELQTVKNKVTMVLTKTQARSRTHAVAVALANGWITQ